MLAPISPTLETTYALQFRDSDGSWSFTSQAEYTSADDCREQAKLMYGGAFADPSKHRVVAIKREILD